MSATLLGAVLSFMSVDGSTLELTLMLDVPAAVAVRWGDERRTSPSAREHHFRGLRTPTSEAIAYQVEVDGLEAYAEAVEPPCRDGHCRLAVYGDDRDGPGPHQALIEGLEADLPTIILNTGDIVRHNDDETGWKSHLGTTLRIGRRVPVILALGNHELYTMGRPADARRRVLSTYPAPQDPLAESLGLPSGVFRVMVGDALFIVLDSNTPLGPGSPQRSFVEQALDGRGKARHVFVALHHGPVSAGSHGGHPEGAGLSELFTRAGVTAVFSGHDHTYQRIVRGGVSYVVTGGGGAPLYEWRHPIPGVQAFSSTYNWVSLALTPSSALLSSYSIEGALLDRAELTAASHAPIVDPKDTLAVLALAIGAAVSASLLFGLVVLRYGEARS